MYRVRIELASRYRRYRDRAVAGGTRIVRLVPGAAAAERPSLEHLGKYLLLEVLGSGGFGRVYKARDVELDRLVALKVPRDLVDADGGDSERFLREAVNVSRLKHAGIVTLFDAGQVQGIPFLASEFVAGTTLSERLKTGGLTFQQAAEVVALLAEAVAYAHGEGVIHRDIKPSNVMLDALGQPRLMDFGLAKRDAADVSMTMEGTVLGTPAYMSPEQAAGRAAKWTAAPTSTVSASCCMNS